MPFLSWTVKKGQIVKVDKEKYLNSINVSKKDIDLDIIIGLVSIDMWRVNVSVSFCWAPTLLQRIGLHL